MTSRKVLYIHIGTGKTGTSYIQQFVENNDEALRSQHNLVYLSTGREDAKHRRLDFNARRRLENCHDIVVQELKMAKQEILSSTCENHLISDEDFPGLKAEEIETISELFLPEVTVRIIVYLRRQDEYLESWFGQIVKTGSYTPELLKPWEKAFGRENVIVRAYEKNQFKNYNLQEDFISVFGIKEHQLAPIDREVNTSLSRDKILLLRKLARNNLDQLIDKDFIEALKKIDTRGDSKYVLSKDRRQEIVKFYESSNNSVSERYLNRGVLFENPLPLDDGVDWVPRSEVPDKLFLETVRYVLDTAKAAQGSAANLRKVV